MHSNPSSITHLLYSTCIYATVFGEQLMDNIIDMHCHVLPGVDDGSEDLEMSLKMLQIAADEGITQMILTPHFHLGRKLASYEEIEQAFSTLQQAIIQHKIPIEIFLGNEIFYSHDMVRYLETKKAHAMCGSRYVLVEYHPTHSYQDIRRGVEELLQSDFIPIIAHVERYDTLLRHPERVEELIDMGAYIQVNVSDVMGDHGFGMKRFCAKLLKKGLVHFIATDAHSDRSRAPRIKKCVSYIIKKYGAAYATELFCDNPTLVMRDEYI